uniref:Prolyl 4-hydroxylase alpha subunit Fe(2+) 2OG dioxygenase domain-containing protein n=1 Tax=Pyramimonas obovata TaxID=1411642 RepID=A0A7S0NAV4_9CHLO|mmetsp:Transcript_23641/g.51604  ORF Transcript_23641/g.51604 Transcript_23641/m.51604 type:complete len:350 (+) Transcript_23641:134-1183(+)
MGEYKGSLAGALCALVFLCSGAGVVTAQTDFNSVFPQTTQYDPDPSGVYDVNPAQAPIIKPAANPETCQVLPHHVDYTVNRLANSVTIKAPFEHTVIHDVFHPELYACMLAHLPKAGANYGGTISKGLRNYFKVMDRAMGGYAVPKPFMRSQAKYLLPTFESFWRQFSGAFSGTEFRDKWLDLFKSTLSMRFPQLKKDTEANRFYYRMDMARDGLNYFINPHTDSVAKVVTILYYMPLDASHPELGTVAFRSNKGLKDDGRGMTWKPEMGNFKKYFTPVTQGAFVPNTVFAFAPCTSAWHGVYHVPTALQRDTLQGFISMDLTKKDKSKQNSLKVAQSKGIVKGRCTGG